MNKKAKTKHYACLIHFCLISLRQFRRSVSDILKPEHDDHFLLRWLRARQWNPDNAEKMLREVSDLRNMEIFMEGHGVLCAVEHF